jgi:hypothetical protein
MSYFLLCALAAVFPALSVGAETSGGRNCRIVFPERPNDAPKTAYLFDGQKSLAVTLPSMNFSEVITLPPGELTLLMTAEEIRDPENLPRGAPKLRIAEGIRDFYILVSPDPDNAMLAVKMTLVDAGRKLKSGETLWFNLTDHLIAAKLGQGRMTVAPKGITISKDPVPKSGYYKAELAYQPNGEGNFQRITEQSWWHDTRSRHLGFIVNTGGMLPRIYFFRDYRAPDAAEAENQVAE